MAYASRSVAAPALGGNPVVTRQPLNYFSRMSDHDSTQSLVLATGMGDRESMDRLLERHVADLRLFVRLNAGPVVRARE